MLIFKSKLHFRGTRSMEDLKRCLVYWIERGRRQAKNEQLTVIFDMLDSSLANIDLEYAKTIINTLKLYYPNSLNWILVYEIPWSSTVRKDFPSHWRAWKLSIFHCFSSHFSNHKKLLPKKAVERLKTINSKNARNYIDVDNMPVSWGGNDDYEFTFVPENRSNEEIIETELQQRMNINNNNSEHANLNLLRKKVSLENPFHDVRNCIRRESGTVEWKGVS